MTSESRKHAWMAKIHGPIRYDDLLPWGVTWRFNRYGDPSHTYHLKLGADDRLFEAWARPDHLDAGHMAIDVNYLAPLLRTRLSDEQLAKGLAAILTYSSQKVSL